MEKMYTVKEAARELNVTAYTVRNYIKNQKIKAKKYTATDKGSWFISESEIKRFKGE